MTSANSSGPKDSNETVVEVETVAADAVGRNIRAQASGNALIQSPHGAGLADAS